MGTEEQRRYGWCKRTGAWVARDDMLGMHVQVFGADGSTERLTIRLHPEAHRRFVAELRDLEWDNVLRTRADLEAAGEPIREADGGATDTAAWYDQRRVAAEDDRAVARVLMRSVLRASNLDELEGALVRVAGRVAAEALVEAMAEAQEVVPRWDEALVDLRDYDGRGERYTDRAVSADDGEVLILRLEHSGALRVLRTDHDRSEAVLRARGVLRDGPPSVTR